jgi:hypothetical protein
VLNVVKDEKGDLVIDNISARWRNHFSQLLNVHGIIDVRQTEIHAAGPLEPEPSDFEFEMGVEKLKRHKSLGVDQIPTELIKAGIEQFAVRSIKYYFNLEYGAIA